MNSSPHLEIDFLLASQADKHVTVNDAFERLDALTQLSTLSVGTNIAPLNPNLGDRHIVGSDPLGSWSNQANQVAMWTESGWRFFRPKPGWCAWHGTTKSKLVWDGLAWTDWVLPSGASLQNMGPIGINAAASQDNPLTSAGPNTLLTHAGGGHRLAVNKANDQETAGLILQSNFVGRAELSLENANNLRLKSSPDGMAWKTHLEIDTASGLMTIQDGARIGSTDVRFGAPSFFVNGLSQTYRSVSFCTLNKLRFDMGIETSPEIGDAAGSNFYVNCFSDTGDFLSTAITINRSSGAVSFNGSPALSMATLRAQAFSTTGVPNAAVRGPGAVIYVNDEAGGPVLAFSDGITWRRMTDRAPISI